MMKKKNGMLNGQFTVYDLRSTKRNRIEYQSTVYRLLSTKRKRIEGQHAAYSLLSTNSGIALVVALVITLAVTILIVGTLYVVTQSTIMSGAGKRYATASDAADGAIEVMKAAIQLIANGEPVDILPISDATPACLLDAVLFSDNVPCVTTLKLPGSDLLSSYSARITVMRLYSSQIPGSRLEFPKSAGGPPSTAIYYRINAIVTGAGGTRAETSALYRYVF